MSSEKRRRRRQHGPILIEENIIIDSKSTTITTHREEQKRTANTRRQWYPIEENSNETLSERIERVLRKINGWTNDNSVTSTTTTHPIQIHSQQNISLNKTNSSAYDNIPQGQSHESHLPKSTTNSFFHTLRQQCCSSNYCDPTMVKNQSQPISITSVDECVLPSPLTTSSSMKMKKTNSPERQEKKVRMRDLI